MTNTQITDVDELPRLCKDPISRSYLSEAVLCYKSGAFRSAIANVWLAIVHNCMSKIEELALLGDKEANRQKEHLDSIRKNSNIQGFLGFEREILDIVKDKFQLIDELTYIDLKRIQEDRHRCVHPTFVSACVVRTKKATVPF